MISNNRRWRRTYRDQVPRSTFVSPREAQGRGVDEWEKQFGMEWKRFLAIKRWVLEQDRVMLWDDSAGKECFIRAERWFWTADPPLFSTLPSPDMYTDEVDWDINSKIDPQILQELEETKQRNAVTKDAAQAGWDVQDTRLRLYPGLVLGDKDGDDRQHHGVEAARNMNGVGADHHEPTTRDQRKRRSPEEINGKWYPYSMCAKRQTRGTTYQWNNERWNIWVRPNSYSFNFRPVNNPV